MSRTVPEFPVVTGCLCNTTPPDPTPQSIPPEWKSTTPPYPGARLFAPPEARKF
ncbi:MAG TPA: hypothetical protein VGZ32_15710 [Actinocrinis sp.]|uniref:hypothetical protein n=1 Tax=Actinocrinis sp. TaxID=1920516 RepID=UPI002DDDB0A8|nr:hypothetical protein [Actinocrinis sp.]HEV3171796.1 hypothetical protein [Actinocrinis sp.]